MEFLNNMFYWGLSYQNIVDMFILDEQDLSKHILDCMGAPSSFNAIAHEKGQHVVSYADVYGSSKDEIQIKMNDALRQTMMIIEENPERFVASAIDTPNAYEEELKANLKIFMHDYNHAIKQKRYLPESLPMLEFANCEFNLVLCRHFLFVHNENFSLDFHIESIKEMCRVAGEVRIFPLLNAEGHVSEKLPIVMQHLQEQGYDVEIRKVHYEVQKGANAMLRVWQQECMFGGPGKR